MNSAEAVGVVAVTAYLVLVALLLGSFINLAADRLPRRESLVRPRSHCRTCGRVLNLVDLIPIGGYVIRGGRCASCGASIGATSPAVEALCGALMLAPLALFGPVRGAAVGGAAVLLVGVAAVGLSFARTRGSRRGFRSG
jgi:prepilin signal peptidase PulO-like enzyme (type II secretory pathway)